MIPRRAVDVLNRRLADSAAVALLGPRQVGKTTIARDLVDGRPDSAVYLDLERPADRRRLDDADAFLRSQAPRLVVLDEVHRVPGLFAVLRGVIDDNRRSGHRYGQFLLLGSASLDLVQMSGESLAGRIALVDLTGVNVDEAAEAGIDSPTLWLRGGYPDSLLAADDASSARWRTDVIRSYLERDVPMFAPRLPAETLRRLWTMVAHNSGGLLNAASLGRSLGVSGPTVDRYLDLLVDLGLVRRLEPWFVNTRKRVTKAPQVFVRDTGLLHALLEVETMTALRGHPSVGSSFESFVVEALIDAATDGVQAFHYRSATGDEIDLLFVSGGVPVAAVEVKLSTSPTVGRGFHRATEDLGVRDRFVVHPDAGQPSYRTAGGVIVAPISAMVERVRQGLR